MTRDKVIQIRVSQEEHDLMLKLASERELTISDYIRTLIGGENAGVHTRSFHECLIRTLNKIRRF